MLNIFSPSPVTGTHLPPSPCQVHQLCGLQLLVLHLGHLQQGEGGEDVGHQGEQDIIVGSCTGYLVVLDTRGNGEEYLFQEQGNIQNE
jgi:hypothetical protein